MALIATCSGAQENGPQAQGRTPNYFARARMTMMRASLRLHPEMTFGEAVELYIDLFTLQVPGSGAQYKAHRTLEGWREYGRALGKLFGDTPLKEIEWWKIHAYHEARARNDARSDDGDPPLPLWERPAGPNKIIQESCFLRRLLTRAGAWTPEHEANYVPLRFVESDIPRALTPDEQRLWLETAAKRPEWKVVYYYSIVGFATGINHVEGRQLRLCDINLFSEYLEIRSGSAKNKFRIRTIPLDPESQARWALERLMERARQLGAAAPSHYLYPFRRFDHTYDANKPMSSHAMTQSWDQIRELSGLLRFCPKDARHTAITRWAEAGIAIHVIMSMAGHINAKMQRHYIAISEQAKRKAIKSVTVLHNQSWEAAK